MDDYSDIFTLVNLVRETSFSLHRYLKHGHLEKVYENGLAHRLRKRNLQVQAQCPLAVYDEDGTVLGKYFADVLIDSKLVVELKACRALLPEHTAQLLGYLRACRIEHGVLINFGAPKLQIKKYILQNEE
jgi:GxxExxY protein